MRFDFLDGSAQQRDWFNAAVAAITYPLDRLNVEVQVSWPEEPPVPGHKEFACTTVESATTAHIYIRRNLDAPGRDTTYGHVYEGWRFYRETVAHEIGHIVAGVRISDPAQVTAMFGRGNVSEGYPGTTGDPSDWSGAAWQDNIQEAVAETFKDLWLPRDSRAFDNRTNWQLLEGSLAEFCELMGLVMDSNTVPPNGFAFSDPLSIYGEAGDHAYPSVSFDGMIAYWAVGTSSEAYSTNPTLPDSQKIGGVDTNFPNDRSLITSDGVDVEGIDLSLHVWAEQHPDVYNFEIAYPWDRPPPDGFGPIQYDGWAGALWKAQHMNHNRTGSGDPTIIEGAGYARLRVGWKYIGLFPGWTGTPTADEMTAAMDALTDELTLPPYGVTRDLVAGDSVVVPPMTLAVPPPLPEMGPFAGVQVGGDAVLKPGFWVETDMYLPSGPGALEDWQARQWTVSGAWGHGGTATEPDPLPAWPYTTATPQISPDQAGTIRRSRADQYRRAR